jgi:hypothetical protein
MNRNKLSAVHMVSPHHAIHWSGFFTGTEHIGDIYIYIYIYMIDRYYEELAHRILEAKKSQEL